LNNFLKKLKMKLAIVGSRTFTNYLFFKRVLSKKFHLYNIDCIISGGAGGVDTLAETFADMYDIPKKIFYPKWAIHGKQAGFIRNEYIIGVSDELIAFCDVKIKGTENRIDIGKSI